jgi:hypothetical protein
MRWYSYGIFILLISGSIRGEEELEGILKIGRILALSQSGYGHNVIDQNNKLLQEKDCDELYAAPFEVELTPLALIEESLPGLEAEVRMAFEIRRYSGINTREPEIKHINHRQDGFAKKWEELVRGNGSAETIKNICKDMDQESAIAFAGYIGGKNNEIYDDKRTEDFGGGSEQARENLSLKDYYQAHKNNEGWGDPNGRKIFGICGDSASMVADFISKCGFSCEDVDIVSYRTPSGGHQMVAARGSEGQYYSADWSFVESVNNNIPLGQQKVPNLPDRASATVELFDCKGASKGKSTTPLGTLLMIAHEDSRVLNIGNEYDEIATVINGLGGIDEMKLKAFRGRGTDGEKVYGGAFRAHHEFNKGRMFSLEGTGSFIMAYAKNEFLESSDGASELDQIIASPYVNTRLNYKAIQEDHLQIGFFGEVQAVLFILNTNLKTPVLVFNESADGEFEVEKTQKMEKGLNVDYMAHTRTGAIASYERDNMRLLAEAGIGQDVSRNRNQKGDGMHLQLNADEIFANAEIQYLSDKEKMTTIRVNYRDMFLIKRSIAEASVRQKINKTEGELGVMIIKNPDSGTVNSFNFGLGRNFKIRDNYVELRGNAQYLIVENGENQGTYNVSVKYEF